MALRSYRQRGLWQLQRDLHRERLCRFSARYSVHRLQSGGPFQLTEANTNQVTNGVPLFTFPNPFPSSLASASVPSQSIRAYPMETDNGVIRQFNLTVEREIGGIGLRASYIGSRGSGFNSSLNMNKRRPGRFT